MEQWASAVELTKAVAVQASNIRLANCVGLEAASRVATLAKEVGEQLGPYSPLDSNAKTSSACRLAIETLLLVDAVDIDLLNQMSICFDESGLLVWGFSVELAEAICFGLAAVVYSLAAQIVECSGSRIGFPLELEEVGRQLDGIALNMYGALCRLSVDMSKEFDSSELKLVQAFQTLAAWNLSLVCCCSRSGTLTSEELWEWANGDPTLAFVLVKGIVKLDPQQTGLPTPSNLADLRIAAIEACLRCTSPMIAFKEELDADLIADDIDGGFGILHRMVGLSQHRARVSVAVSDCDFLDVLLQEAHAMDVPSWLPTFVAFVSVLVQPPPDADNAWVEILEAETQQGLSNMLTKSDVLGIADAIVAEISTRSCIIWELLLHIPLAPRFGPSVDFLRNCASLAFVLPLSCEGCQRFVGACFAGRSESSVDVKCLTMLCALAANCRLLPENLDELVRVLAALDSEAKRHIIEHLARCRVPMRYYEVLVMWKQLIGFSHSPTACPEPVAAIGNVSEKKLQSNAVNLERCAGQLGLRKLLQGAPAELSCALDGKLLVDPVRSPYGHIFERSNLASVLTATGRCPITGQSLALEDCPRDAGLRIQALQWVRMAKSMHQHESTQ